MPENLQDVQEVAMNFPGNSETYLEAVITHNLINSAGAHVAPDTVTVEIVEYPGAADLQQIQNFVVTRSSPEDGTYVLRMQANTAFEGPAAFLVRLTHILWHSVQGDDHTP